MLNIFGFIVCGVIIFFAGKKLAHYGDIIAGLTGIGRAWIGLILLASVTSLPELMVGISSSAFVGSADLAVGDILGSCAFNLGILAMMDYFVPHKKPLLGSASSSHVMAAAMGIILITMAGVGIYLPNDIIITQWVGLTSLSFVFIYFASMRLIYRYELKIQSTQIIAEENETKGKITLKKAITQYILFASITIAAALFLPYFAEHIAEMTGLGKTFVGTLFLAASTSLPEIAVSLAAIRMGTLDLAVGNLLGSNLFNIFILALDDLFYTKGHILKDADPANMISVFGTIIMSAVVIIGLTYHSPTKRFRLAWDAILIFLIYLVNMVLLYKLA